MYFWLVRLVQHVITCHPCDVTSEVDPSMHVFKALHSSKLQLIVYQRFPREVITHMTQCNRCI